MKNHLTIVKGSPRSKRGEPSCFWANLLELVAFLFFALCITGMAVGFTLLHPVGGFHHGL